MRNRKERVRYKAKKVSERNRLTVFRSNNHLYAQLIDDTKGLTLASSSSIEKSIKITPTIEPEPTLIFKGKRVIINLNGNLKKDQTYIVSINKNLEDEHKVRL